MFSSQTPKATGEPPAKKLRVSTLTPGMVRQLPSPDRAHGSSSDSLDLPSSTSPKRKPTTSFQERIFPQNHDSSLEVPSSAPAQHKTRSKTSIAPIFQKTHTAASQPGPESNQQAPTPCFQPIREHSPDVAPEDLLDRLKKQYLDTASTLHERASIQLDQAHTAVSQKLLESVKWEDAFLSKMDMESKTLCAPLDQFKICFKLHDPVDGSFSIQTETVGKLVSDVEAQVAEFEADLTKLWEELEVADAEVARVYRENLPNGDGSQGRDGEEAQLAESLNQLWMAINKQIQAAEEEIAEMSTVAVAAMKDIEKDFRKVTLPDLHIFFQSIDEP